MSGRAGIEELGLSTGKKARLSRILHQHGLGNGTALFLSYDSGLGHGPKDFTANPASSDPRYVLRLGTEGAFNAITLHIGLAEKFFWDFAGELPLILRLNGDTGFPPAGQTPTPVHSEVADAVRLGADAVGYTLRIGAPDIDYARFRQVRADAQRLGMPVIVWAEPRVPVIAGESGHDSFYAVDYATRVASELGADIVNVNFPQTRKWHGAPASYRVIVSSQDAIDAVVRSANRTLLMVSVNDQVNHSIDDEEVLDQTHQTMQAGAAGLTLGRALWRRKHGQSLRFITQLHEILAKHPIPNTRRTAVESAS